MGVDVRVLKERAREADLCEEIDNVPDSWEEAAAHPAAAEWAYWYAKKVIKARWPEGEEAIMSDAYWAERYKQTFA